MVARRCSTWVWILEFLVRDMMAWTKKGYFILKGKESIQFPRKNEEELMDWVCSWRRTLFSLLGRRSKSSQVGYDPESESYPPWEQVELNKCSRQRWSEEREVDADRGGLSASLSAGRCRLKLLMELHCWPSRVTRMPSKANGQQGLA
ncbi:unnamed protein product [Linum tenue]|uniref:Uncharacterized protein n=1 Tax=Linum tenue TaxID=586396 RepID=A0AAV0GXF6_9ROSI|nr:unnamed protein product [Linum tenue]